MYASTRLSDIPTAQLFRSAGRASAVILFVSWLGLFVAETMHGKIGAVSIGMLCQAAALAVVFVGYAVGWRHELAGGLLAIVGTAAFFVADGLLVGALWSIGAVAWFAAPGVLYLLAWLCDRQHANHVGRPA